MSANKQQQQKHQKSLQRYLLTEFSWVICWLKTDISQLPWWYFPHYLLFSSHMINLIFIHFTIGVYHWNVVTLCFVLMFVFMCESDFKKLKFVQLWTPLISRLGAFRANKGKLIWIYTKTKKLINAFILSETSWLR